MAITTSLQLKYSFAPSLWSLFWSQLPYNNRPCPRPAFTLKIPIPVPLLPHPYSISYRGQHMRRSTLFLIALVSHIDHGTISNGQIIWWSSLRFAPISLGHSKLIHSFPFPARSLFYSCMILFIISLLVLNHEA